ncbi:uncharacterized protein F5891DRAFT_976995 [Suillus fuscotomentosus]|uniref:Uncharacterized protein n=1 Tax=Suillus fuscotomentosus TaxID=1912939 RepID=A0AAD4EEM2_9AGAM|nr:uncharacterized protein F5891DRAFT_976995 [Suillus fuscotomentosus]KAG1904838.1 hypothetical protein F5891DRAFT_976995 [Suillus fuscotomentosus]
MFQPVDAAIGKTGGIALIQVAYQKVVYLIQSKAYHKVGVNVMSNLQQLQGDCILHAILESYVTWSLYLTLTVVKAPQNVTGSTQGGTAVTVYAPNVMVVQEVLVPGYLILGSLLALHTPTALSAFGPASFTILCQANHLQTSPVPSLLNLTAVGSCKDQTLVNPSAEGEILSTDTNEDSFQSIFLDTVAIYLNASIKLKSEPGQPIPDSSIDEAALEAILQLILDITNFVPKSMDLNVSYDTKLISKLEWILTRVHHYVPPPEILFSQVVVVVKTYGPLKDVTTGQPLFNDKA